MTLSNHIDRFAPLTNCHFVTVNSGRTMVTRSFCITPNLSEVGAEGATLLPGTDIDGNLPAKPKQLRGRHTQSLFLLCPDRVSLTGAFLNKCFLPTSFQHEEPSFDSWWILEKGIAKCSTGYCSLLTASYTILLNTAE